MNATVRKLSEMSDQGAFERLATAILREAQPEYAALLHPGVNVAGKTVKSPVDAICFVQGAQPSHMIVAHHTTVARGDLAKKWLYDPASISRKGRKTSTPAGDLVKTAEIVAVERSRNVSLKATLILTTNQEPPEELVRETHAAGERRSINIDMWSVSRLAHIIDTTPSGQWLRHQYLGIEQQRLSRELLAKLSQESMECYAPLDDEPEAWISRNLDVALNRAVHERDTIFVIAESGLGKSVACFRYLKHHVTAGGMGLIIPHDLIASAPSIEHAINAALRQLHPQLAIGCEVEALSFCSIDRPLILVIEDINRSGQAQSLIEKITRWNLIGRTVIGARDQPAPAPLRRRWRLLCPVWPQIIAPLRDQVLKHVETILMIIGEAFTPTEGRKAVQRRARLKGILLSDIEADGISETLDHDPLLIALQEPSRRSSSAQVIDSFIDRCVKRLAAGGGQYMPGEYRTALRRLACAMLSHCEFNPAWSMLQSWFEGEDSVLCTLREIIRHRELVRLSGSVSQERLTFRHDRLRNTLCADAIADLICTDRLPDSLIAEPYFAEIIGAAILRDGVPIDVVDRVRAANCLALFHALRGFREPQSPLHQAVLAAITAWLAEPGSHSSQNVNLRWDALAALSQTESTKVVALVQRFPDVTLSRWEALFRNGNVAGGLSICLHAEPGTGAVWRDRQISHAKLKFGSNLTTAVGDLLRRPDLDGSYRIGALRLAGHLADPALADALEVSWNIDSEKGLRLREYLWACAQCCGANPERLLDPVCEAWAALPCSQDGKSHSPRNNLAAENIQWAFSAYIPVSALGYFIKRAEDSDLRWPITYMLHGVDNPEAVEFVVREMADIDRRLQSSGGFSPFLMPVADEWRRRQEGKGQPMSRLSRDRLLALWQNRENDKNLRHNAFRFWATAITDEDLTILRAVDVSDPLSDSVLWERLRREDRSAIPDLLQKLKGDPSQRAHWWHLGQCIWSGDLTEALDEELIKRNISVAREWNTIFSTDCITYQLMMALPAAQAETMFLKHWDHLRFTGSFIQAALYIGTPRLLTLVSQTVAGCPNPTALFKYLSMHYGIRTKGRDGVTKTHQMESLSPYMAYLDEYTIYTLWEVCNDRGWFELRRRLIDSRISKKYGRLYIDKEQIDKSLDALLDQKPLPWVDMWIENYLKTGATRVQVIDTVAQWLNARKTFQALQIAATAIIAIGGRRDLAILNIDIEHHEIADALRARTAFAVKRRTLN